MRDMASPLARGNRCLEMRRRGRYRATLWLSLRDAPPAPAKLSGFGVWEGKRDIGLGDLHDCNRV